MRLMISAAALATVMTLTVLPASAQQKLRVTASTTNLRAQPTATSTIVENIPQGAELEVVEPQGSWYLVRVRTSGAEGFVHSLVVQAIEGTSPALSPPAPQSLQDEVRDDRGRPGEHIPVGRPAGSTGRSGSGGQQTVQGAAADRTYSIRPFGGLFNLGGTTGFLVGGGIAGRPFGNDHMEVQGDYSYLRFGGLNAGYGSASFLYNFPLQGQSFTPIAGAGIGVLHGGGAADAAFQLLGGIQVPINDRRAFRGEVRFVFTPGDTAIVLAAGLSF